MTAGFSGGASSSCCPHDLNRCPGAAVRKSANQVAEHSRNSLSQFWRPEVQTQGSAGPRPPRALGASSSFRGPGCAWAHGHVTPVPAPSSHGRLSAVCLCTPPGPIRTPVFPPGPPPSRRACLLPTAAEPFFQRARTLSSGRHECAGGTIYRAVHPTPMLCERCKWVSVVLWLGGAA